jgi:hypothetical protein
MGVGMTIMPNGATVHEEGGNDCSLSHLSPAPSVAGCAFVQSGWWLIKRAAQKNQLGQLEVLPASGPFLSRAAYGIIRVNGSSFQPCRRR